MSTVLIVDDEPLIRWAVRQSLEEAGYAVVEAGSAGEAVSCLPSAGEAPLSVALLDLRLPDSDDLSLMRRLRGLSPGCRVIIMTAHGTPEILHDAMTAGAFGTISKPFDLASMVSLVRAAAAAA